MAFLELRDVHTHFPVRKGTFGGVSGTVRAVDGVSLYSTPDNPKWDSGYYFRKYLWPLLELMRLQGEPTLMAFSDEEGKRLRDAIYSCHSYRRGSETFSKTRHPGLTKRASLSCYFRAKFRFSRENTKFSRFCSRKQRTSISHAQNFA